MSVEEGVNFPCQGTIERVGIQGKRSEDGSMRKGNWPLRRVKSTWNEGC